MSAADPRRVPGPVHEGGYAIGQEHSSVRIAAAILAAGRGDRFGGEKTSLSLAGKPVWRWSFETYRDHPSIDDVFVVSAVDRIEALADEFTNVRFVAGGTTRQLSAKAALDASGDADILLLHDAARPFVAASVIGAVIDAVLESGAAAAGCPVTDTIKQITSEGIVTLPRSQLVAMQTPQGARTDLLRQAHAAGIADMTDDMALLEAIGIHPSIVTGPASNFKITTADDYLRARTVAGGETRTGIGYDVHPFSDDPARTLWLGGVDFPGHRALEGHSDADALLHAAVDALLGAAALADIGQHFPNTDPRWKGEPSLSFVRFAGALLVERGWRIVNLDLTCVAESPKIMKRAADIRAVISEALGISPDRISVKATTNERMGFVGRGEGIAALAVATISNL